MFYSPTPSSFSETNTVFQLFKTTAAVFLVSSVITGFKIYLGNPIDCIYEGVQPEQKTFIDNYCWKYYELYFSPSTTSFTATQMATGSVMQQFYSTKPLRSRSYYEWLPLVLLLQALLAYTPSWMWNNWRDGRVREAVSCIDRGQKQANRRKLLVMNLASDLSTPAIHKRYAKPFLVCECLNVICLGLNLLVTNLLFRNRFLMYGFNEVGMRFKRTVTESRLGSEIFPQLGKCSLNISKKNIEATCWITFSSVCETVFMFIWVWLMFVTVASVLGLGHRSFMILSRRKRRKLLMEPLDNSHEEDVQKICEKLGFYSWFTLYRISRNVNSLTLQDIISSLINKLESCPIYKTIKCDSKSTRKNSAVKTSELSTIV